MYDLGGGEEFGFSIFLLMKALYQFYTQTYKWCGMSNFKYDRYDTFYQTVGHQSVLFI